jgi:hypothetical protein
MSNIFISYSHQDEAWKDRLVKQLKVLEKQAVCTAWHDRDIEIGGKWYNEIINAIEKANIFILLISADFMISRFINDEEIPRILERRGKHGSWVIPVIARNCDWQSAAWLSAIQATPQDGAPWDGSRRRYSPCRPDWQCVSNKKIGKMPPSPPTTSANSC